MENIPLAEPQRPRLVDEMKQLALDAFGSASESVRAERMQELEKKLQE